MIKESKYKVIETQSNKPLVTTEKDHEDFSNSAKCRICKKAYEEGEEKVKNHNLITGKYWGSTNWECTLNLVS